MSSTETGTDGGFAGAAWSPIGQHEGNRVALADAKAEQGLRNPVRQGIELAVGDPPAIKLQRRAVRVPAGRVNQKLGQGNVRIGEGGRNPRLVLPEPGPFHGSTVSHVFQPCQASGTYL